ncbi:MAG: TetR/AcrR family transcriptional regulator [Pseudomonadota bacterium]
MPLDKTTKRKQSYHHGDLERSLLDAAEIELEENGIERFSLRAVAKRASVSHGAPAHHFGNADGLLTALASRGYGKFIAMQDKRESLASDNPKAKLAASGLGYIDFAIEHPALFRLMFASERTDKANSSLAKAANAAFEKLTEHIEAIQGIDPHTDQFAMADVLACWGIAHGLADLTISQRLGRATFLAGMSDQDRDAFFSDIILRGVSPHAGRHA